MKDEQSEFFIYEPPHLSWRCTTCDAKRPRYDRCGGEPSLPAQAGRQHKTKCFYSENVNAKPSKEELGP